MKHILLFTLLIGLFVGAASADMYVLDTDLAQYFEDIPHGGPLDHLDLVIDNIKNGGTIRYTTGAYSDYSYDMALEIGFVGLIQQDNILRIGTTDVGGIGSSYDSYGAWASNDNEDPIGLRLYAIDDAGVHYSDDEFVTMTVGLTTFLDIGGVDFSTLSEIGFEIKGLIGGLDQFHVSFVPVPAAVILGILGLGIAGIKLRKYA